MSFGKSDNVSVAVPDRCRLYVPHPFSRGRVVGQIWCPNCDAFAFPEQGQLLSHELSLKILCLTCKTFHCRGEHHRMKILNPNLGQHVQHYPAQATNLCRTTLCLQSTRHSRRLLECLPLFFSPRRPSCLPPLACHNLSSSFL